VHCRHARHLIGELTRGHHLSNGQVNLQDAAVVSIIDDDESVRTAIASLMRSLGFTVDTFASAEDFLSSPRVDETACLISDVQMPGISGIELQSRLAAQGRHTPIIFITAFPNESVAERALKAGATCFLQKPFDGKTLVRCVGDALSASREISTPRRD
jgi:FixJ family two-component response regulator